MEGLTAMSQPPRWEYKIRMLPAVHSEINPCLDWLNDQGDSGWELVSVTTSGNRGQYSIGYLKRRIADVQEAPKRAATPASRGPRKPELAVA